jgi:hypothetical protein
MYHALSLIKRLFIWISLIEEDLSPDGVMDGESSDVDGIICCVGSLSFNAGGSYSFDVGSDFQDLDATESRDVTFTYYTTTEADAGNISAPATVTYRVRPT